jgi:hypothetical protein
MYFWIELMFGTIWFLQRDSVYAFIEDEAVNPFHDRLHILPYKLGMETKLIV